MPRSSVRKEVLEQLEATHHRRQQEALLLRDETVTDNEDEAVDTDDNEIDDILDLAVGAAVEAVSAGDMFFQGNPTEKEGPKASLPGTSSLLIQRMELLHGSQKKSFYRNTVCTVIASMKYWKRSKATQCLSQRTTIPRRLWSIS